jgi:hypothetical protein
MQLEHRRRARELTTALAQPPHAQALLTELVMHVNSTPTVHSALLVVAIACLRHRLP